MENQYGEDITKLNASSLTLTAAGADSATANTDGSITITKAAGLKKDDKVVLTVIHAPTATATTKTVTISAGSMAAETTIGNIYNKDGKILNEDINLTKDKFYVPVEVKDQYGDVVTDLNRLNGTGGKTSEVLVTNTNPAVATIGSFEKITIDGKDVIVLPVSGIISAGETNVIVISKSTGANTTKAVKVAEGVRADQVTLGAPTKVVTESDDILFPLSVQDKQGNAIKDTKVLNGTNGIKITGTGTSLVEKEGQLYVQVVGTSVSENTPVTVVVTSATSKVATQTVIPKAATTPKVITGLNSKVSTAMRAQSGAKIDITSKDIIVEDQYGQVIPADKLIAKLGTNKIKAFVDADAPFTVSGSIDSSTDKITVTYKAGETKTSANVTFKMENASGTAIESSAFSKEFKVIKDSTFESYKVENVDTIYVKGAAGSYSIPSSYGRDIVVKAISEGGSEVKLTAGTDFTVNSVVLSGINDGKVDGNNAANIKFATDATTTTAKVTVTINATGQELVKDITFSNVAPKVQEVKLVEDTKANAYINETAPVKEVTVKDWNPASATNFDVDELYSLVDIVAIDQYGVMSQVVESSTGKNQANFDNVQTADITLTLTKVSGDLVFSKNGKTNASVDEISQDAVFNVRVNLEGVSATPIKVTAKKAYSQIATDNIADVGTAKTAVQGATYGPIANATANTQATVKAKVKDVIDALDLKGATYEIVDESFTAAVASTSDGTYKFKVKLTKGAATDTSSEQTVTISK